ncbi:30S ribosomal protein S8 [Patescibacteria group bacterium]|nr:30S ribosomal protein S8 [Patescibacteria group bacterium]
MAYAGYALESWLPKVNCQALLKQLGKENMNHTVSDFIIRIKNATLSRRKEISVPFTRVTREIAKVLVREGFLEDIKEQKIGKRKVLTIKIRYRKRIPVLTDVEIISKPSLRIYSPSKNIADLQRRGMYTMILSTNEGIMTGNEAYKKKIGGEIFFKIW